MTQANLPAYLTDSPALVDTGLGDLAHSSQPRISSDGGVFRIISGSTVLYGPVSSIDAIIIGAAPLGRNTSRTFYSTAYQKGSTEAPTCSSVEGITPDANVISPQASSCETCPQNIAGSGPNNTRACAHSKTIAVQLVGQQEVYPLKVSALGLFSPAELVNSVNYSGLMAYAAAVKAYGASLGAGTNLDISKVVTRIACPHGSNGGIRFTLQGWAEQNDYAAAVRNIQAGEVARIMPTKAKAQPAPTLPPPALAQVPMPAYIQQTQAPQLSMPVAQQVPQLSMPVAQQVPQLSMPVAQQVPQLSMPVATPQLEPMYVPPLAMPTAMPTAAVDTQAQMMQDAIGAMDVTPQAEVAMTSSQGAEQPAESKADQLRAKLAAIKANT